MSLRNHRPTWAGALLFLGGASFWLINTISESLYPDYTVHDAALSRLGSLPSPTRWLWNSGVMFMAITWLLAVYLLFLLPGRRLWFALNLLPPFGVAMVSLFPAGSPDGFHSIATLLVFVTSGCVMVADGVCIALPFRFFSLILGTISLGTFTFSTFSPFLYQVLGQGGNERIVVYPIIIWLMSFGGFLMGRQSSSLLVTEEPLAVVGEGVRMPPQHVWQSQRIPAIVICLTLCWFGLMLRELAVSTPTPPDPSVLLIRSDCAVAATHQAATCTLTITNPSRSAISVSWRLSSTSPVAFSSSAGSLDPGHSTTIRLTLQESLCSFVVTLTQEYPNAVREIPLGTCSP